MVSDFTIVLYKGVGQIPPSSIFYLLPCPELGIDTPTPPIYWPIARACRKVCTHPWRQSVRRSSDSPLRVEVGPTYERTPFWSPGCGADQNARDGTPRALVSWRVIFVTGREGGSALYSELIWKLSVDICVRFEVVSEGVLFSFPRCHDLNILAYKTCMAHRSRALKRELRRLQVSMSNMQIAQIQNLSVTRCRGHLSQTSLTLSRIASKV